MVILKSVAIKKTQDLALNLLCFSLLLFSTNITSSEKENWNLRIQKDDVTVYTKKVAGSQIDAFKATTLVNAAYEKVKQIVLDYPNYPKWYQDYKSGEILEQLNQDEIIVHFVINAPFPIKDRDSVNRVFVQETDERITITLESTPTFIPHKN